MQNTKTLLTRISLLIVMVLTVALLGACQAEQENPADQNAAAEVSASPDIKNENHDAHVIDDHNSENALDWAGTYRGVLPCADCAGIETVLTLQSDKHFILQTRYLDKGQKADILEGDFTWSKDGRVVILNKDAPNKFQVGENVLFVLNMDGNRIEGALAEHYRLTRVPNAAITEHYWKLVTLDGQAVAPTQNEAHLILKQDDNRVNGSGGCNRLNGTYILSDEQGVQFQRMASTRMACPQGMDVESAFLTGLEKVKSYAIQGDNLVLYDDVQGQGNEIARFEAVYLY